MALQAFLFQDLLQQEWKMTVAQYSS